MSGSPVIQELAEDWLVIMPEEACLFAQVSVKQNETVCLFRLAQKEDQFRPPVVIVITRIE